MFTLLAASSVNHLEGLSGSWSVLLSVVMASFCQTLEAAESSDCTLMDRDLMQVIFTLAKAGHQQHLPEVVDRLRHERGYVPGTRCGHSNHSPHECPLLFMFQQCVCVAPPDAMNLCLSLITQGLEDTAFYILKTFPTLQSDSLNLESSNVGNFFLRHCVTMDTV